MEKVYHLLRQEPVRVYLYGVVTAVVAALAATGVVTASLVPVILAVGATVLAVPAIEKARGSVVPVEKVAREIEEAYGIAAEGDRLVAGEGREPSDEELEGFHPEA